VVVELWPFEIAAFWGVFGVARPGGWLDRVAKTLRVFAEWSLLRAAPRICGKKGASTRLLQPRFPPALPNFSTHSFESIANLYYLHLVYFANSNQASRTVVL
jgi:hypothetical protein